MVDVCDMDVVMVYCQEQPHPAHQGFANSINAETYGLNDFPVSRFADTIPAEIFRGTTLNGYDICIAEGTRALYGCLAHQFFHDSLLIYLAADQSLYQLQYGEGEQQPPLNRLISSYGMSMLESAFNRYIDGTIAVSDFAAGYTTNILKKPTRVVAPYIQPSLYGHLDNLSPHLELNTAITVGEFAQYKGQDLLVEAWKKVQEQVPNATLKLVGKGYPERLRNLPSISVLGYVDDLPSELESASLYVQPSRADSFPVSVLEALWAGLPTLVTTTTGNRTEAQHISDSLVVEPTVEDLADGIIRYFDQPVQNRRQMSIIAKRRGKQYNEETQKKEFREAFSDLIGEIR